MVIAEAVQEWLEKRKQEQIRRAVRRAVREVAAEWENWNRRRMRAERRGEPFDEPPPAARNGA